MLVLVLTETSFGPIFTNNSFNCSHPLIIYFIFIHPKTFWKYIFHYFCFTYNFFYNVVSIFLNYYEKTFAFFGRDAFQDFLICFSYKYLYNFCIFFNYFSLFIEFFFLEDFRNTLVIQGLIRSFCLIFKLYL